jgi:NADH-quinone oxidoreductase subunit L
MTIPLMILAFFSLVAGFMNVPSGVFFLTDFFGAHRFGDFLGHTFFLHSLGFNVLIALSALALGIAAIIAAGRVYGNSKAINEKGKDPLQASPSTAALWNIAHARLWWDEFYFKVFENPYNKIADFLGNVIDWQFLHDYFHNSVVARGYNTMGQIIAKPLDLGVIDGAVNGVLGVRRTSGVIRRANGLCSPYTVALLFGAVIVIILMLLPLLKIG